MYVHVHVLVHVHVHVHVHSDSLHVTPVSDTARLATRRPGPPQAPFQPLPAPRADWILLSRASEEPCQKIGAARRAEDVERQGVASVANRFSRLSGAASAAEWEISRHVGRHRCPRSLGGRTLFGDGHPGARRRRRDGVFAHVLSALPGGFHNADTRRAGHRHTRAAIPRLSGVWEADADFVRAVYGAPAPSTAVRTFRR